MSDEGSHVFWSFSSSARDNVLFCLTCDLWCMTFSLHVCGSTYICMYVCLYCRPLEGAQVGGGGRRKRIHQAAWNFQVKVSENFMKISRPRSYNENFPPIFFMWMDLFNYKYIACLISIKNRCRKKFHFCCGTGINFESRGPGPCAVGLCSQCSSPCTMMHGLVLCLAYSRGSECLIIETKLHHVGLHLGGDQNQI